jgi:hypothetical protein
VFLKLCCLLGAYKFNTVHLPCTYIIYIDGCIAKLLSNFYLLYSLLHVSALNLGHLQGATSLSTYKMAARRMNSTKCKHSPFRHTQFTIQCPFCRVPNDILSTGILKQGSSKCICIRDVQEHTTHQLYRSGTWPLHEEHDRLKCHVQNVTMTSA